MSGRGDPHEAMLREEREKGSITVGASGRVRKGGNDVVT